MGSMTIRNIDDAIKAQARLEAARNGRSLEAEIRALLERTYAPAKEDRAARIREMSGDDWVSELIAMTRPGIDMAMPPRIDVDRREVFGAD